MAKKSDVLFAILVAVLFFGSTFSVWLYSQSDNSDEGVTKDIEDPLDNIMLNYSTEITGKVLEVPIGGAYSFFAYTNNENIVNLDYAIRDLNGVKEVNSRIEVSDDNTIGQYIYVAYILTDDLNTLILDSKLKDINGFLDFYLYPYVKVEYNSDLVFYNLDLNESKNYSLGGNEITLLGDSTVLVGDVLNFRIDANFSGNVLKNYNAYLVENLSLYSQKQTYLLNKLNSKGYNKIIYGNYLKEDFNFLNLDFNFLKNDSNTICKLSFDNDINVLYIENELKDYNSIEMLMNVDTYIYDLNINNKNYIIDKNIEVYEEDLDLGLMPGLSYKKYNNEDVNLEINSIFSRDEFMYVNNIIYRGN